MEKYWKMSNFLLLCGLIVFANGAEHYKDKDKIPMFVNKVGPYFNPQETYHYYSLPVCRPEKVEHKSLTLGEVLDGDRMAVAQYKLLFKDDLPVRGFIGHLEESGFLPHKHKIFLWSHLTFNFEYNKDQVISVNVSTYGHDPIDLTDAKEPLDVEYTYSVTWHETSVPYSDRLTKSKASGFFPKSLEIHWLSIINSAVLVFLLIGFVSIILMRVLKNDFSRYNVVEEEAQEIEQDDCGWKMINADVFRFPKHRSLLCSILVVSGFVSNSFYKQINGDKWAWNLVLTASLFSVGFPLTVLGGIFGKNWTSGFNAPCRTKNIPREIPSKPWYRSTLAHMVIGGFLPFSAISVELYYIFSTLWGREQYTLYGILLVVFLILLSVTASISVALTYFQLSAEDYQWWWASIFCSGSYMMLPLLLGRFYLEYIMACLSTLGGAYSSLGEQSKYHATIAGKLSIKQLAVASKLNNPILASHCKIYHAHSLMQTRKFKAASKIIKLLPILSWNKTIYASVTCCAQDRNIHRTSQAWLEDQKNKCQRQISNGMTFVTTDASPETDSTKPRNDLKITKAGAEDDVIEPYGRKDEKTCNGVNSQDWSGKSLDKYGIDIALDGSLRRSKKKKKKSQKQKSRINEERNEIEKDERAELASILDSASAKSPVRIITTLVDRYGPSKRDDFEVQRGDQVVALFRQGDFVVVERADGVSGLVPVQICFLVGHERFCNVNKERSNGAADDTVDKGQLNGDVQNGDSSIRNGKEAVVLGNHTVAVEQQLRASNEAERETEVASVGNLAVNDDNQHSTSTLTRPRDRVSNMDQTESDSLARRIKRHEIRQLLKQDTQEKMTGSALSNQNSSCADETNDASQQDLVVSKQSLNKLGIGSQSSLGTVNNTNRSILKSMNGAASQSDGITKGINGEDVSNDGQTARNGSSRSSLNAMMKSQESLKSQHTVSRQSLNRSTSSRENLLAEKLNSQQSLNSTKAVQRNGFAAQNGGSQQSLNSLRSNSSLTNQRELYHHIQEHFNGDTRSQNGMNLSREDERSLNSFNGSLQELYHRDLLERSLLARKELDARPRQELQNGGYFYQGNNEPSMFTEARIRELLSRPEPRNHQIGSRRCSSLRKSPKYTWMPPPEINGFSHELLTDEERAMQLYSRSISAPGSRVMSPDDMVTPDTILFALRDFQSTEKDDLGLRRGERVLVVRRDSEGWWWVRNCRGEEGFVPSNYLIPLLKPWEHGLTTTSNSSSKSSLLEVRSPSSYSDRPRNFEADIMESYARKQRQAVQMSAMKLKELQAKQRSNCLVRSNTVGAHTIGAHSTGFMRANTVGSQANAVRGQKIDWSKFYNVGNGSLARGNGTRERSDVESKEALLQRIRNEVEQDPVKGYLRSNGRSSSNENMHSVSVKNEPTKQNGVYPEVSKRTLSNEHLYSIKMQNGDEPRNHFVTNGDGYDTIVRKKVSNKIPIPNGQSATNGVSHHAQSSAKLQLPSYSECVQSMSPDQSHDQCNSNHSDSQQDNAEISNSESVLYETPRVLRRRRTYSGASNKKVRYQSQSTFDNETEGTSNDCEAETKATNVDDGLSTWC
eukprot:Seg1734.4 transcript_id=Seg1734.4/GoldUCD/mRNA.D3Y31 product="Transmembrane 9 superfamily member 1" protein_id=Seg1734.4/GoldUCD/D3Y31